ncbi:hypothetical protein VP01_720g6 [Puccinia sorghi]|uniref:Uncharacterized protein n=1 Tax=Puccinia sorghi TaxID=27349 RepID=A0A0L6UD61_9BASI|nr:hypothetical protein VP01_720g6 [Puccinia sorghi]
MSNHSDQEDDDDTFRVDPNDGTTRLNALFKTIFPDSTNQSQQLITSNNNSIVKPKPPLAHLRGCDPFNKLNQTRSSLENHSHNFNNQTHTQRLNGKTSLNPNYSKTSQKTTTRTGWRSGPLISAKKSNSDTDNHEDPFKSDKPTTQDLSIHTRDRTLAKPLSRRASLDHQKRVTFEELNITASRPAPSPFGGLQSRHPPPPSDSTDTEDLNNKTPLPANTPYESNSRLDHDAQTTLATPRMAGYYPSTPATTTTTLVGPSTSRLVADEDAERRLEKLKNQAARSRMKRVSSVLEEERGLLVATTTKPSSLMDHHPTTPKPVDQQPSSSSQPSHQTMERNGKGKEKSNDPLSGQSTSNPQPEGVPPLNPAHNNNNNNNNNDDNDNAAAEAVYDDQTIINPELTRGSCLPTPHLPGWFPATPARPSSSARQTQRPIIRASESGALKQGGRRTASRLSHEIHPYILDPLDKDDPAPRPAKRPARRPTTTNSFSKHSHLQPSTSSSIVPAPTTTHQLNPDFSAPSFDGFDDARRQFLLTSTPANPGPKKPSSNNHNNLPAAPSLPTRPPSPPLPPTAAAAPSTEVGPSHRLKELAATVIEFIVEKNPIEALAERFSRNNERQLHKSIRERQLPRKAMAVSGNQQKEEELEKLLKSAERVELERVQILTQLDRLHHAPNHPSILSRLATLAKSFLFSSQTQKSNTVSSLPLPSSRFSSSWKLGAFVLICHALILWMAFQ